MLSWNYQMIIKMGERIPPPVGMYKKQPFLSYGRPVYHKYDGDYYMYYNNINEWVVRKKILELKYR